MRGDRWRRRGSDGAERQRALRRCDRVSPDAGGEAARSLCQVAAHSFRQAAQLRIVAVSNAQAEPDDGTVNQLRTQGGVLPDMRLPDVSGAIGGPAAWY